MSPGEVRRPTGFPMGVLRAHNQSTWRQFWIDNSLAVPSAPPELVARLRAHADVLDVTDDSAVFLSRQEEMAAPQSAASAVAPQDNIAALNTGPLWSAGFTGQGVVVATIDSGVRWTHEAVVNNYRGSRSASGEWNHDYAM
jgi:subtilisin family serine protease